MLLPVALLVLVSWQASAQRLSDHPVESAAANSSWQAWLLLDSEADESPPARRITPKSVFIAPAFAPDQLPACADGYRADAMGRCVKVLRVQTALHLDYIVRHLNAALAKAKPQAAAHGPLQMSLPVNVRPTAADSSPPAATTTSSTTTTVGMVLGLLNDEEDSPVPTVLTADPPEQDMDVRDTLPMLVFTHTDSSSPLAEEGAVQSAESSQLAAADQSTAQTNTAVGSAKETVASNTGPVLRDTDIQAQTTSGDQETAQPNKSESSGALKEVDALLQGHDAESSENVTDLQLPVPSRHHSRDSVSGNFSEDSTAPNTENNSIPVTGSSGAEILNGRPSVAPYPSGEDGSAYLFPTLHEYLSKKSSTDDSSGAQTSFHPTHSVWHQEEESVPAVQNDYGFPSPTSNNVQESGSGLVRFPQDTGGFVRFPADALQPSNRLWWLQPGPGGWRVQHADPRVRPALVRFWSRPSPPPLRRQHYRRRA